MPGVKSKYVEPNLPGCQAEPDKNGRVKGLRFFHLGSFAAGLVALLYFGTGLAHLALLLTGNHFLPGSSIAQGFQLSPNQTLYGLAAWAVAIPILLALMVALQLSDLVYKAGPGWVRWSVTLVLAGYAIAAIKEIADLTIALQQAQIYVGGDPLTLAAFKALEQGTIDPDLFFQTVLIAGWFMVIHLTGLQHATVPRRQAFLGLAYAGLLLPVWLAVWTGALQLALGALAVQELVVGPAWYLATAFLLFHQPAYLSSVDN